MNELCTLLDRHCVQPLTATAVPRLLLTRAEAPTGLSAAMFMPLFCVIAQGRKRAFLGNEEFYYDPTSYLIASADLPVAGQVVTAPYLGLTLAIDPEILAELLPKMPTETGRESVSKALAVSPLAADLLDPTLRLLRLLDQPQDIPLLAPLIEREILYRLLQGPKGEMLRQLVRPSSQLSQIKRAMACIQTRFHEPIRMDELAKVAGMSAPSLHRHFRAVTSMSPLQFQKRIRLQEARTRLLSSDTDAAQIGFDVGYESPSQFSREYRRMFGEPPRRDVTRVRRSLIPATHGEKSPAAAPALVP